MRTPRRVHIFVVRARAKDLAVTIRELAIQLSESCNLGRTDKGKVLRPEEVELPLPSIRIARDRLEGLRLVLLGRNSSSQLEIREFFSNLQHVRYSSQGSGDEIFSVRVIEIAIQGRTPYSGNSIIGYKICK
jgi:hypothetical protein